MIKQFEKTKMGARYNHSRMFLTAFAAVLLMAMLNTLVLADGGVVLSEQFMDGIESGDINKVRDLLIKGVSANTRDNEDRTALIRAVATGNLGISKLLLESGGNVNATDANGRTPLMWAVCDDPNDTTFISSLDRESHRRDDNVSLAKLLLQNGANVNIRDKNGESALIMAVRANYIATAKLLLSHGAESNLTVSALIGNFDEICKLLNSGHDVNEISNLGITPLIGPILGRNLSVLKVVLNKGADINLKVAKGDTPLIFATMARQPRTIELLLANGANVDLSDDEGRTPLMMAAEEWQTKIVRILLKNGARVNAKDRDEQTALMLAVKGKPFDPRDCPSSVVGLLISAGAQLDCKNREGMTALMMAQKSKNVKLTKILKGAGARE